MSNSNTNSSIMFPVSIIVHILCCHQSESLTPRKPECPKGWHYEPWSKKCLYLLTSVKDTWANQRLNCGKVTKLPPTIRVDLATQSSIHLDDFVCETLGLNNRTLYTNFWVALQFDGEHAKWLWQPSHKTFSRRNKWAFWARNLRDGYDSCGMTMPGICNFGKSSCHGRLPAVCEIANYNPCHIKNGGCAKNSGTKCYQIDSGIRKCTCLPGYKRRTTGCNETHGSECETLPCLDINECAILNGKCRHNKCINLPGGHKCEGSEDDKTKIPPMITGLSLVLILAICCMFTAYILPDNNDRYKHRRRLGLPLESNDGRTYDYNSDDDSSGASSYVTSFGSNSSDYRTAMSMSIRGTAKESSSGSSQDLEEDEELKVITHKGGRFDSTSSYC